MDFKHLLTVAATAIGTAAPIATVLIPPPFNILASAAIAAGGAVYHLYEEPPNAVH